MSESKFTPGPWVVGTMLDHGTRVTGISGVTVAWFGTNGSYSARECHRITNTEAFANAELFSAAPELLACLEELVTLKDTKPHDYEERKAKAWRAAREAINKARGGK